MKTIHLKLHPRWRDHTGHCQITYTTRNEAGQKLVYCLQDNGDKFGGVRLMRCSQDGEPSHEVEFTSHIAVFERPPRESRLEVKVNAWIDRHEGT